MDELNWLAVAVAGPAVYIGPLLGLVTGLGIAASGLVRHRLRRS